MTIQMGFCRYTKSVRLPSEIPFVDTPDSIETAQDASTRNRIWPLVILCTTIVISDIVVAIVTSMSSSLRFASVQIAIFGFAIAQVALAMLLGGLLGRSWLKGILISSGLAMIPIVSITSMRDYSIGNSSQNIWLACAIPFVVMVGASPLLLMRLLCGWRLDREPNLQTRRGAIGIEEMLIATSSIAAFLFVSQIPLKIWNSPWTQFVVPLAYLSVVLFIVTLVFVVPAVRIAFRIRNARTHWLSLFAITMTGVICFASLFGQFSFGRITYDWAQWITILSAALPIYLGTLIAFKVLRFCGFRLARYENALTPATEASKREYEANRNLHRTLGALVLTVAIAASVAQFQIVEARNHTAERNFELLHSLEKTGGSIGVNEQLVRQLSLGTAATDSELGSYTYLKTVTDLSLANTQITDEGLSHLKNFRALKSLDLSNTKITDAGLEELKDLKNLEHLSIAGTKISPSKIPELLRSSRLTSIDVGNLGLDDEFVTYLRRNYRLPFSISVRNNIISDTGLKELWLHDPMVFTKLDLSGTEINGSGFVSKVTVNQLILKDLPISDGAFGPTLPNLTVHQLCLSNTRLTDSFLATLAAATTITDVELGDGNFSEDALPNLGTRFTRLGLTGKQFTGDCFKNWAPALYSLDMSSSGVTDDSISILQNLPRLTFLKLSHTTLTDAALPVLAKLQSSFLDLSHTKITAKGLLANPFSNLNELRVAFGQFTPSEIRSLQKVMRIVEGKSNISWPY